MYPESEAATRPTMSSFCAAASSADPATSGTDDSVFWAAKWLGSRETNAVSSGSWIMTLAVATAEMSPLGHARLVTTLEVSAPVRPETEGRSTPPVVGKAKPVELLVLVLLVHDCCILASLYHVDELTML